MQTKLLSQSININNQNITGPLVGINNLADLINKIMKFLIPVAFIILLFVLIWGGFDYMMSQGNPEKVKSAQGKLTTGVIGIVLLLVSYLAVKLIAYIFGLNSGII